MKLSIIDKRVLEGLAAGELDGDVRVKDVLALVGVGFVSITSDDSPKDEDDGVNWGAAITEAGKAALATAMSKPATRAR
jgi:hypothetical protein